MDEGKIYITISDQRVDGGDGGGQKPPQDPQDPEKKDKNNLLTDYFKHSFFNFVESQAKQMVNYTVSNIGNFTGDYQSQRNIESAMKLVNVGVGLVSSFVAGMSVAGPVGGAVAVAFSMVAQGVNFGLQEHANRVSNRNQNYNISQLREISGLDALTNGGR